MFKKGDIVRLVTGSAPIRVMQVSYFPPNRHYIYGEYVKNKKEVNRYSDQFVLYEEALQQQE